MHFCIKCICNILLVRCKNAFLHQMHFCKTKCTHQMHFCKAKCYKCIWCYPYILLCWTFSFGKCTPKCILASNAFWHQQNVRAPRKRKNAVFFALQKVKKQSTAKNKGSAYILLVLNIFQRKMFSKTKCYKCIWCKNGFDAKIDLMQKCIWCKNRFDAKIDLMQK